MQGYFLVINSENSIRLNENYPEIQDWLFYLLYLNHFKIQLLLKSQGYNPENRFSYFPYSFHGCHQYYHFSG